MNCDRKDIMQKCITGHLSDPSACLQKVPSNILVELGPNFLFELKIFLL